MAYDTDLADRIRELLGPLRGVDEKRMFGGLAFLINGNMGVAVSGQGGLMVRVPAERHRETPGASSCQPDGDGRTRSARVDPRRRRRRQDQTAIDRLGDPRRRLCASPPLK